MKTDFLRGENIQLTLLDGEHDFELFERWSRGSEYARLLDFGPVSVWAAEEMKEWHEKNSETGYTFIIRKLEDGQPIGFIGLDGINALNHDAWVGIGIGEEDCWGQGYGADAMRVMLRYAFQELNLHRVNLDVFVDNPRAIKSYENAGFVLEGISRERTVRDGRRWDIAFMGVLRSEWKARNVQ